MSWFFSWIAQWFGLKVDPARITQIQAATVRACGFLPMAETVAALVTSNPAVLGASVIAHQICNVVKAAPVAKPMGLASMTGEPPPAPTWGELNGIPIQGEFIK